MIALFVRILKRLAVLLLGAGAVYVGVWKVFPFFDHRIHWAAALFVTYVIMAYGLFPALVRGIRLFFRPSHIPLYCITPDGFASDPINLGLIGSRQEVIQAMEAAGWYLADAHTLINTSRMVLSILLGQPYANAPMSTLYLFGRKQDLGFEVSVDGSPTRRHHVRFWACNVEAPEAFEHHVQFWRRLYRPHRAGPPRQLWVGAATKDVGIAPIRHNAQLTHMIHPDTNAERERIVGDLKAAKRITNVRTHVLDKPYRLQNRAWRGYLKADGRVVIGELSATASKH